MTDKKLEKDLALTRKSAIMEAARGYFELVEILVGTNTTKEEDNHIFGMVSGAHRNLQGYVKEMNFLKLL